MSASTLLAALLLTARLAAAAADAPAAGCERDSPVQTVALVELFTSEGCSSCPPADRWLATLRTRYGDARVLPLSLHVDYWDYIGWADPFAQKAFGERQRVLARRASAPGNPTIYTPEVFVGLRELRGWRDATTFEQRLQEINRRPAPLAIRLAKRSGADGALLLEASVKLMAEAAARRGLQMVLVVYEDALVSNVRHGENSGVTLRHEHVVRYWSPPLPLAAGTAPQVLRAEARPGRAWQRKNLGLAAFVYDPEANEVLQAVALPACAAG